MLSQDELAAMVAAEEKRLGVGSREFMERHNEIMGRIDSLMRKGDEGHASTKRCYYVKA